MSPMFWRGQRFRCRCAGDAPTKVNDGGTSGILNGSSAILVVAPFIVNSLYSSSMRVKRRWNCVKARQLAVFNSRTVSLGDQLPTTLCTMPHL